MFEYGPWAKTIRYGFPFSRPLKALSVLSTYHLKKTGSKFSKDRDIISTIFTQVELALQDTEQEDELLFEDEGGSVDS